LIVKPPARRLFSSVVHLADPLAYDRRVEQAIEATGAADRVARWTDTLATEIGPRRPTSRAERTAAEWLREQLREAGVDASLEPFRAYATFALPQSLPLVGALAAGSLGRRHTALGGLAALLALGLAAAEDDLRLRPLSRLLARRRSQNLVATIEPQGAASRTLCLVSHIDASRSGLLFHPAVAPRLRPLLAATSAALAAQAAAPVLDRALPGRALLKIARAWLAGALALLTERELRGRDVPGANDNASGAALTAALAAEIAASPLESTRVVLLVSGAEEAGTLGADAFLRSHDTSGWLFLNFDGVAAPATLRYLPREGLLRTVAADPGLIEVAAGVAARRPELGLEPAERLVGLTYDATPVLARGGRALTISAQDETIPNYHQPTDDFDNVDPDVLARALEVGRELIAAIERGEVDRR
jgi:hypothetical protein